MVDLPKSRFDFPEPSGHDAAIPAKEKTTKRKALNCLSISNYIDPRFAKPARIMGVPDEVDLGKGKGDCEGFRVPGLFSTMDRPSSFLEGQ
jgi:hypothetical protein